MRWDGQRESDNVEDRRGSRAVRLGVGGGIGTLLLVVLYLFLGGDPRQLLQQADTTQDGAGTRVTEQDRGAPDGAAYTGSPEEEKLRSFVGLVLGSTENVWHEIFRSMNRTYEEPKLRLFTDAADSACGFAQAAVGPFYCPADHRVYIDLTFYQDLQDRFGAPGDFAQAYVIAHEVGHHVQYLLGIAERMERAADGEDREGKSSVSVRMELQADCFAGIWANHMKKDTNILEPGDLEEGLAAASAIGDDRIQMRSRGYVAPESFTHGSSEQRVRWFRRGLESGELSSCDTFQATEL